MMAEALPAGAVKTFTIGFGERELRRVGSTRGASPTHFGTDHHEDVFTPERHARPAPDVADFLDEPFADASILPTYLLSRFTREHVTVALGGDGSDELLAGYPTFTADRVARLYPLPRVLHERLVSRSPIGCRSRRATSASTSS